MKSITYQRVLLKLSGESLAAHGRDALAPDMLARVAGEVGELLNLGVEVGLVIGGGNIFRGLSTKARQMDRVAADHMGMLATVINCIAMRDALNQQGFPATVFSAIPMEQVARSFTKRDAVESLARGEVALFAAGTGNPFFTTDTAAALRAVEIGAQALLKGTRVEGIFSADPEKDSNAQFISRISYTEVLERGLRVMDQTAFTLCQENQLAVHIFNMEIPGNLLKLIRGESIGSLVGGTHVE